MIGAGDADRDSCSAVAILFQKGVDGLQQKRLYARSCFWEVRVHEQQAVKVYFLVKQIEGTLQSSTCSGYAKSQVRERCDAIFYFHMTLQVRNDVFGIVGLVCLSSPRCT